MPWPADDDGEPAPRPLPVDGHGRSAANARGGRTMIRDIPAIGAIAARYDAWLVDQWGVIHDGTTLDPDAVETIVRLAAAGRKIVLLSNSGRRAALNRERLLAMGFPVDLLAAIVTSGEAAWNRLRTRPGPPWRGLGRRCRLWTIGGDLGVVEDAGLDLVERVEDADFIFATGLDLERMPLGAYEAEADAALARGIPMVCSNPDKVAPSATGFSISPGTLAARHEAQGGAVHYVGKPFAPIYEACFAALPGIERARILAVGDSLHHDIKGAKSVGLDACLVRAGIHKADLAGITDTEPLAGAIEAIFAAENEVPVQPDWVIETFRW